MRNPYENSNIYERNKISLKAIILILLVFALIASVWQNYDMISMMNKKSHYDLYIKQLEQLKDRQGLSALKAKNSDFIAWITIEDVEISIPIVKTDSVDKESYYLTHDFDKKENVLGSPYQKYGCDIENTTNTTFVGHSSYNIGIFGNIVNQSIFGSLNDYLNYDSKFNYKIKVETLNGTYTYEVFSVFKFNISADYDKEYLIYTATDLSHEVDFNNFVNTAQTLSKIKFGRNIEMGDKFLTLFTCSTDSTHYRTMVVARLVK